MKTFICIVIPCLVALGPSRQAVAETPTQYDDTWTSLRQHTTPRWLIDAKFGIYCHWGASTIRYQVGNEQLTTDEAITKFKAERFDAAAWADLFQAAGARFAGPVAWHGSPYLHWDSKLRAYNSVQLAPHIDILGSLEPEIKKRGMKFITSFHSIGDEDWIDLAKEAVDKYQPDIFWVDASFGGTKQAQHLKVVDNSRFIGEHSASPRLLDERYQRQFLAYYFNHATAQGKEVEFVYKSHDIPPGIGMRDLENGLLNQMAYDTWMTDIDMNKVPDWKTHGWFYREGIPLRSADNLIDILVDVVSKNGILLLNVPPRADGTFAPQVRETLEQVGEWLRVNGQAIYGASPWFLFGEGPTVIKSGSYSFHHTDHFGQVTFTDQDIRFTTHGKSLYAICLGAPEETLTIRTLTTTFKVKAGLIRSVSLLGCDHSISWKHNEDGLTIQMPKQRDSDLAAVFKIEYN